MRLTAAFLLAALPILTSAFHFPARTYTLVCRLQGDDFATEYGGKLARTQGVVTADLDSTARRGFYIQEANCDADPETSDGVFVYLGVKQDVVRTGDRVEVLGTMQEYYGRTEIVVDPAAVTILSGSNLLPEPVDFTPPFDESETTVYREALEGMLVRMDQAVVVGPTSAADETWVARADLGIERVFEEDERGHGEILCVGDSGLVKISPEARVGDRVHDLQGVLDYRAGLYCLDLTAAPVFLQTTPPADSPLPAARSCQATLGTFNLTNLFDTQDDPAREDTKLSAAEYQRRLKKRALAIHDRLGAPDLLAVQEVENLNVLQALISRPEMGGVPYAVVWEDGPDERGIDVALLYRSDRVQVLGYETRQGCTALTDGFGPDGNRDVENPQNAVTCDSNGDGTLDGNRLFSRPPLVVRARLALPECDLSAAAHTELWVLVNHFKSKVEDSNTEEYTLPRRIEEAQFVASLIGELRASPAGNVVVLGDLNDYPASEPLLRLEQAGLASLWELFPDSEGYTYVYQGVSQTLDYALAGLRPGLAAAAADHPAINADYPAVFEGSEISYYRSGDHDPVIVRLAIVEPAAFLPLAMRP